MGNKKQTATSRRDFLKKTGIGLASFMILPRHVLGGKGFVAPSDKLNVAAIGCGGKGASDIENTFKSGLVNMTALCDVDDRQAKNTRKAHGKTPYYRDFRKMLEAESRNIDAVIVSSPDHTHFHATLAAMQLGKHVYVQKPLTHSIWEARQLTEAARKYKVVTQMGNQGASGEGVRQLQEWYQAGLIGEVNRVLCWTNRPVWAQGGAFPASSKKIPSDLDWDLWTGPAALQAYMPSLHPFNWRGFWNYGTGALGDMGCHIIEAPYKTLGLGYPSEVECSVGSVWEGMFKEAYLPESCPASSVVHLKFPREGGRTPVKLSWFDGGILPERPELLPADVPMGGWSGNGGGMILAGERGIMMAGVYGSNPKLYPASLNELAKEVPKTLPRVQEGGGVGHHTEWIDACKKGYGNMPLSSTFDYSGPLTEAVLMGNLAIRSYWNKEGEDFTGRKKLLWDGKAMRITNYEAANQFVKRTYRKGWEIGKI
ncbi:MAG: hypothetical protein RL757_554 [Bacteroidota bacterium]|jgi:hypothetical protein